MPELGEPERHSQSGFHRDAHDRTRIGIDSRRDIDSNHGCVGLINRLDRATRQARYRGVESGAEDRIDDYVGALDEDRGERSLVDDLVNFAARIEVFAASERGITLQTGDTSQQYRAN